MLDVKHSVSCSSHREHTPAARKHRTAKISVFVLRWNCGKLFPTDNNRVLPQDQRRHFPLEMPPCLILGNCAPYLALYEAICQLGLFINEPYTGVGRPKAQGCGSVLIQNTPFGKD